MKSGLNYLKTRCFSQFILTLTLLCTQISCTNKNETEVTPELAISENKVYISKKGGSAVIAVTASEPWGAIPDDDEPWCELALTDTRLTIICAANNTGDYRSANIRISTAHKSKGLTVSQSQY